MSIWEIFKLIFPILTAFLAGYLVSRWKTREDMIEKRCDQMCAAIAEISQYGQTYWLNDQAQLSDLLLAAKIQASQQSLSEMRVKLEQFLSGQSIEAIVEAEQNFQRAITGGDFGVHNRKSDVDKARTTIYAAKRYETTIRMSRMQDIKGYWRRK